MNISVDRAALDRFRLYRLARGRCYYLAEPPVLGILVIRTGQRLEEIVGLTMDAALGHERGVEGWCEPGYAGRPHGKATLFRVVDAAAIRTLSEVLATWCRRFPMR